MRCKDCSNFKSQKSMEAASELSPSSCSTKGTCDINSKSCSSMDKCSSGGFKKK